MVQTFTMRTSSPVISCHILGGDSSQPGQLHITDQAPAGICPGCPMAAPNCGSAHGQAEASCCGEEWEGGKRKDFSWCAAPPSTAEAWSTFIASVKKTLQGKANTVMAKQSSKTPLLNYDQDCS